MTNITEQEYNKKTTIEAINSLINLMCIEIPSDHEHDASIDLCHMLNRAEDGETISIKEVRNALNKIKDTDIPEVEKSEPEHPKTDREIIIELAQNREIYFHEWRYCLDTANHEKCEKLYDLMLEIDKKCEQILVHMPNGLDYKYMAQGKIFIPFKN